MNSYVLRSHSYDVAEFVDKWTCAEGNMTQPQDWRSLDNGGSARLYDFQANFSFSVSLQVNA